MARKYTHSTETNSARWDRIQKHAEHLKRDPYEMLAEEMKGGKEAQDRNRVQFNKDFAFK